MAIVIVPAAWKAALGGATRLQVDAASVGGLIAALQARSPELTGWLGNGLGGLPEYLNVFVGDADIRILDDLATPLAEDSEVRFILIMAGGSVGEEMA